MRQVAVVLCVLGLCAASGALDQTHAKKIYWGIGTGFTFLNAEGDQGIHVNVADIGPVLVEDFSLDPDDFNDMMESAFGFGGYVTDGTWMVMYQLAQIKLGGDPSGDLPRLGASYEAEWSFDILQGELLVGYPVYQHPKGLVTVRPHAGIRYMKHEVGAKLDLTGAATASAERSVDHNWTDFVLGGTADVAFAPKWNWASRLDAGFGGSEGTFHVSTGVSWRFWKHMSAGPNFGFTAIDFENGDPEDSDWYKYDANEFGAGFSFLFHF